MGDVGEAGPSALQCTQLRSSGQRRGGWDRNIFFLFAFKLVKQEPGLMFLSISICLGPFELRGFTAQALAPLNSCPLKVGYAIMTSQISNFLPIFIILLGAFKNIYLGLHKSKDGDKAATFPKIIKTKYNLLLEVG